MIQLKKQTQLGFNEDPISKSESDLKAVRNQEEGRVVISLWSRKQENETRSYGNGEISATIIIFPPKLFNFFSFIYFEATQETAICQYMSGWCDDSAFVEFTFLSISNTTCSQPSGHLGHEFRTT